LSSILQSLSETPLLLAAELGKEKIVKTLLERGANTDAQNDSGVSPLHKAVKYGHENIVKLLLAKGAKFDIKDKVRVKCIY
jgi:ankyrin repeat protein